MKLTPISQKKFKKFLAQVNCEYVRRDGDHVIYNKKGLTRPIVFQRTGEIPKDHIKSNLRTLGISTKEYLEIINKIK